MYKTIDNKNSNSLYFSFLLLPDFSLVSFASAIEPLYEANGVLGRQVYRPRLLSVDGASVCSASSVSVHVDGDIQQISNSDMLFVLACNDQASGRKSEQVVIDLLQAFPDRPTVLAGIGRGTDLLIKAGLMKGQRVTSSSPDLKQQHSDVLFTQNLFELNDQRFSCREGTASMDMMLALISQQQGAEVAVTVSEKLVKDRRASSISGKATMEASVVQRGAETKLRVALDLMMSNIEEPLGTDELAAHVGTSRRQLERIFRKTLHTAPSKYYLQLRLEKAREMLCDDQISIVQVALATGFLNASHFSTAYRNQFNVTPREDRQRTRDNELNKLRHSLPI